MKIIISSLFLIPLLVLNSCSNKMSQKKTISSEVLRDKIAGGWAGKMIGVTYGAPTEFRAQGKTFEDSIRWTTSDIKGSMWQDDIYVQLTFLMTMDKYGIDAPADKFHEMFAKAGYMLWHANMQARKNYFDGIMPPASGSPEYSIHADDIDFQIEADYIGFMCPGMPQSASGLAQKIGHIMNYGDGLYGGIFVAAMYAGAFFESDIQKIIENALLSVPQESDYFKIIKDVLKLHSHYKNDWHSAWNELEAKWGDVDICGAGSTFNIDAKLNGAYIVMGLLYGDGDPYKTMEIATRCGQDSDCNPSNAMAVLGLIKGYSGLPLEMQEGVKAVSSSVFVNTNYSFQSAVDSTYKYARDIIKLNRGEVTDNIITIQLQQPISPELEVSYPNLVFSESIPVFNKDSWKFKGNWQINKVISGSENKGTDQAIYSEQAGDEIELKFFGTAVSIEGNWFRDGGKADIFVDGKFHRTIDTYYFFAGQEHTTSIWHVLGLPQDYHTVKIVVKGEKRPESAGTKVYLTQAIVFKSEPKKNCTHKFSFE